MASRSTQCASVLFLACLLRQPDVLRILVKKSGQEETWGRASSPGLQEGKRNYRLSGCQRRQGLNGADFTLSGQAGMGFRARC